MRRTLAALLLSIVIACGGGDVADDGEAGSEAVGSAMPHEDGLDKKVYPTSKDRELACPTIATRTVRYAPASADLARVEIDGAALRDVLPSSVRVALVLVKRTSDEPRYRYVSNGTHDAVYQPWSST